MNIEQDFSWLWLIMRRNWSVLKRWWKWHFEVSGCGFESRWCHLNLIYSACLEQGVSWHSWFTLKRLKNPGFCLFSQQAPVWNFNDHYQIWKFESLHILRCTWVFPFQLNQFRAKIKGFESQENAKKISILAPFWQFPDHALIQCMCS